MSAPKTPRLTVDIVIRPADDPGRVVVIARRHPPLGFALPGGFVDIGERVEDAARREAYEETGLTVTLEALLGCYSDPRRDPRGHTVSVVYVASAAGQPVAGDDAAACSVVAASDAAHGAIPLVFDHARIMADYLVFLRGGGIPRPAS